MAERGDITIGVSLSLVDRTAIDGLRELDEELKRKPAVLRALRGTMQGVAEGMAVGERRIGGLTGVVGRSARIIDSMKRKLERLGVSTSDYIKVNALLKRTVSGYQALTKEELTLMSKHIRMASLKESQMKVLESGYRKLIAGMDKLQISGYQLRDALRAATVEKTVVIDKAKEIIQGYQRLNRAMLTVSDRYAVYTDTLRFTTRAMKTFIATGKLTEPELTALAGALGVNREQLEAGLIAMREYNRQQLVLTTTAESFRLSIGAVGRGIRMLGRTFFWAGLGTMFLTMSIARLNRALAMVPRTERALRRAVEDRDEAQKELQETLRVYGPLSEEAKMATRRLELS